MVISILKQTSFIKYDTDKRKYEIKSFDYALDISEVFYMSFSSMSNINAYYVGKKQFSSTFSKGVLMNLQVDSCTGKVTTKLTLAKTNTNIKT